MDIQSFRQAIRRQRRSLSRAQQQVTSRQLCTQLSTLPPVQAAKRIGLYLANDGEIDPVMFMNRAIERHIACYLPVINNAADSPMLFAEIHADSVFKDNRFGIPEPVVGAADRINASQLDVILVPLVAFDDKGNRIGMGGGFYDRTLAFKAQQSYHQPPVLIGLAHSFQRLEAIVPAAWDVPLDGVASEQEARLFAHQGYAD